MAEPEDDLLLSAEEAEQIWWEDPLTAEQILDELEVGAAAAWQWRTSEHGIRWVFVEGIGWVDDDL